MGDRVSDAYATASEHDAAAVGWVLHTLDHDDEVTFVAHLDGCADCRATVAEVSAATASVGGAVVGEDPPARLHENLMAAVAAEPHPSRRGDAPVPPDDPAVPEPTGAGATVIPMRRSSRVRRFALVAAVAAVAALVVVIGGLVATNRSLTEQRNAQVADADRVTSVLRDAGRPGAVHATLADPNGGMMGMVVDIGSGPRVLSTGLTDNRPDQTYVLWSLAGAQPHAVGTFDVSGSGPSVRSVGSAGEAGRPQSYAVSIEPGRVAPASPTTIVASGQVGR